MLIYHASLLGHGALAWSDEWMYHDALYAVVKIAHGDLPGFCASLTGFGARPAEAVLRLAPASIQYYLSTHYDAPFENPDALLVPTGFNLISKLLLGLAIYRLSLLLLESDPVAALAVTAIYGLLVSSNVYIRHVLPYDSALALCLYSLILVLTAPTEEKAASMKWLMGPALAAFSLGVYVVTFYVFRTMVLCMAIVLLIAACLGVYLCVDPASPSVARRHALAGWVSGLGLAVYPGYQIFPLLLMAIILCRSHSGELAIPKSGAMRAGATFGTAVFSVIALFELISRIGNVSYLGCALRISKTVTQGSFGEGLLFLPRFLVEVESVMGILLMLLALGGAAMLVMRRGRYRHLTVTIVPIATAYFLYGAQSVFLHKMVFYGRIVHMYIPFIVILAVAFVKHLPRPYALLVGSVVAVASLYTFAKFDTEYRKLAYPKDVLYDCGLHFADIPDTDKVFETSIINGFVDTPPGSGLLSSPVVVTKPHDGRFILLNFGYFALEETQTRRFSPPPTYREVYSKPHFLSFCSSRFEAFTPQRRRELRDGAFRVAVLRRRT